MDGTEGQLPLSCLTSSEAVDSGSYKHEEIIWTKDGVKEKQRGNTYVVPLLESFGGGNYTCYSSDGSVLNHTVVLIHEDETKRKKILMRHGQGMSLEVRLYSGLDILKCLLLFVNHCCSLFSTKEPYLTCSAQNYDGQFHCSWSWHSSRIGKVAFIKAGRWVIDEDEEMRIYTFHLLSLLLLLAFINVNFVYSTIFVQWIWNSVFWGSQQEQLGLHFRFEQVQVLGWRQWPWHPVRGPATLSLCWRDSARPRHRLCLLWLLPAGKLLHALLPCQHRSVRKNGLTPSYMKRYLSCLGHTLGFSLCWPFVPGQWDLTRFRSVISTKPWSSGVTRPPGAVPSPTSLWLSRSCSWKASVMDVRTHAIIWVLQR